MKPPHEINLDVKEGDELIDRIKASNLSASDQQLLSQLIRVYFWLTLALKETKISMSRLKKLLFGSGSGQSESPAPESSKQDEGTADKSAPATSEAKERDSAESSRSREGKPGEPERRPSQEKLLGHGRKKASDYPGAERVMCLHPQVRVGEICPLCGQGKLYALPSSLTIRIDGQSLLTAVCYELEKLRCATCLAVFSTPLPPEAGEEKYSDRARAVLALSHYYLGLPFHRLAEYQQLLGVPVADATQWAEVERLAEVVEAVFDQLKTEAAQAPLIYQDDTPVRIQSVHTANRQARQAAEAGLGPSPERTGQHTTGLVAECESARVVLYLAGREHAGENLDAILTRRDPALPPPQVMSDALSANRTEALTASIFCLAHGQRQFSDIEEYFPKPCRRVLDDLSAVFDLDAFTRERALDPLQRLRFHQRYSESIMTELHEWLEQQIQGGEVEPNSSLGKAMKYLLKHWVKLTRFLHWEGAPLDNNLVERTLKLMIRQRRNSLFYASEHGARVASCLTSLIATAVEAGVNVLDYLVTLQQHRAELVEAPAHWLPWTCRQSVAGLQTS